MFPFLKNLTGPASSGMDFLFKFINQGKWRFV